MLMLRRGRTTCTTNRGSGAASAPLPKALLAVLARAKAQHFGSAAVSSELWVLSSTTTLAESCTHAHTAHCKKAGSKLWG